MPRQQAHTREYDITFSEEDWEEIQALGFEPFEPVLFEPMTRGQWMAIGEMALGKAERIARGDYEPRNEDDDDTEWAEQLRNIASTIFKFFQPGDGKL